MAESQFGGVAVENDTPVVSQFGGVPVDSNPATHTAAQTNIPGTNVDYSAPGFAATTALTAGGALLGPGIKSEFDKYGIPGLKPQAAVEPLVAPTFKSPTEVAVQAIKNRTPSVTVEGVPNAVKNYGTSQFVDPEGKGLYYGAGETGEYSGARKAAKEAIAAEKQFPGMKSIQGGSTPFSVPEHVAKELEFLRAQEEAARNAHNQAEVNRIAQLRASRIQAVENAYKELNMKPSFMDSLRSAPVQTMRRGIENTGEFLNRTISPHGMATAGSRALGALGGLDVGLQGTNAVEHAMKGQYGRAAVSGLGALGGAAALTRHPLLMPIGMGAAMAAPYLNEYLDSVAEKHPNLHMADGGSVPEMGTAQAYEPSYNERIRDAIAPYIGMQQARGLMGSQGADSESKYNPLSMLAQVPGSLGQNAKDFVHSSSEGDYLGAMGSYLSGAMDAAPLLGGPGKLARLLNYQAGNKAFDKGIDAAEPYIEKGVKAVAPTIAKGIRFIDDVLPKHKSVLAGTHLSPNLYNGKHVQVEGHAVGGKIIAEGADLAKKLFAPRETKILRASEALAPHEGKWLNLTQSDRMRSTEGDLGGPGFSKFQLERPEYAEAQAAWGVGKKPTASGIVNVNKRYPEGQALWAPMIGGETQHHSNQHVYDMLADEFNRQAGMGKLTPELQARINARLSNAPATKGMFPEGFDIGNPEHLAQHGDTFNRRGALSTVMSGEGVGGTKGRIIDYPGIMQEMTDPMTVGAPTHSIGTRLFSLNGGVEHRPDLHSAFPYILKGEDQGVAFAPVPKELGIQDFINQFKEFKGRDPGYYDLVRTTPSQQITDKYLKSLEAAGQKKGGKV